MLAVSSCQRFGGAASVCTTFALCAFWAVGQCFWVFCLELFGPKGGALDFFVFCVFLQLMRGDYTEICIFCLCFFLWVGGRGQLSSNLCISCCSWGKRCFCTPRHDGWRNGRRVHRHRL
ncbi:unnamed protein product [Pylaiella littoralis]